MPSQITVIDQPSQKLTISLGGWRVGLHLKYNTRTNRWTFDLTNADNARVIMGRKLVLGADLLAPFAFGLGQIRAFAPNVGTEPGREELPLNKVLVIHIAPGEIF